MKACPKTLADREGRFTKAQCLVLGSCDGNCHLTVTISMTISDAKPAGHAPTDCDRFYVKSEELADMLR